MLPWRRQTGQSGVSNVRRRSTQPFAENEPERTVVQDKFPAYDDFPWKKIEDYLLELYPNFTDYRQARVSCDSSVFCEAC
jgi:hypothetical protein